MKPFASGELDELAIRMSVLGRLGKDPKDRWFKGPGLTAYAVGRRVVFGVQFDEKLNDAQRRAVAAHELVHIREGDARKGFWRVTVPSVVAFFIAFTLSARWFYAMLPLYLLSPDATIVILALAVIVGLVIFGLGEFFFRILAKPWRRRMELRCDVLAVPFIDGNELIAALGIQDTLLTPSLRRKVTYRLWKGEYPTTEARAEAIREAMASAHRSAS